MRYPPGIVCTVVRLFGGSDDIRPRCSLTDGDRTAVHRPTDRAGRGSRAYGHPYGHPESPDGPGDTAPAARLVSLCFSRHAAGTDIAPPSGGHGSSRHGRSQCSMYRAAIQFRSSATCFASPAICNSSLTRTRSSGRNPSALASAIRPAAWALSAPVPSR